MIFFFLPKKKKNVIGKGPKGSDTLRPLAEEKRNERLLMNGSNPLSRILLLTELLRGL